MAKAQGGYQVVCEEFIRSNSLMVLATLSPDRQMHTSPIYYLYEDGFNFCFVTKDGSRKAQDLGDQGDVAFSIVDSTGLVSVEARGVASKVKGGEKMESVFKKFLQRVHKGEFAWPPPIEKLDMGTMAVFEIKTKWLRYANFSQHFADGGFIFEEIVS